MENKNVNQPDKQPETESQAQPQQPQVIQQYVVQEKSLKGLGGALIFWMITFALSAIGSISIFGQSLVAADAVSTGANVVNLLFAPILALVYIAATVLIAMQKKLAILVTYIALGVTGLYTIANSIASFAGGDYYAAENVPALITGMLISFIFLGLVALYFHVSKRVKLTLVN